MQHIQWFPGHMTKSMRMMEDNLKLCDGVLFVLDARAPFACLNKKLAGLFKNKPILYLINKCDLIKSSDGEKIIKEFAEKNIKALTITGTNTKDIKSVYNAVIDLLSEKIERWKAKGITKAIKLMVCGIPNTGKSTIINTLVGKKQAATGNKAGVTRGKQWIKINNLELLDTPGTMPPSFDNQAYARHLAYIGSVNDDILDLTELTLCLIEELSKITPPIIADNHLIEGLSPLEALNAFGKKRGYLLRGGEIDLERAAKAFLDDFRKTKLGKICLETKPLEVFC